MVVAKKWIGTEEDRNDMERLKLEQVVRRNFNRLGIFGLTSTATVSWESLLVGLGIVLTNGGTAGLFWTFLICVAGLTLTYLSLAEIGSMFPTSGGQYYWVSALAPPGSRKYLSYITGWICAISWQAGLGGCCFIAASTIQTLFILNIPDYGFQRWHCTLLVYGIALIAISFNTLLARKLPLAEGLLVMLHILGIVIIIPLWVMAPLRKGGSPLVEFNNPGWSSDGAAALIGILGVVQTMTGYDCSIHMFEEVKNSSSSVPRALMAGFGVNALLTFFTLMACIYTLGPISQVLSTPIALLTGQVFVDLFYSATNSLTATNIMTAIIIINFTTAAISILAAASRQLWAFARNNGLPFSKLIAPGALRYDIPLTAIFVSMIITVLISLINIGSTTALGAMFSIANSAWISSYAITIGCGLYRRLFSLPLPEPRFSLGKWSVLINIGALIFLLPIFVICFFPPVPLPQLTATSMNWGISMYGGITILSTIYYIVWGRHVYTPPNYDDDGELEEKENVEMKSEIDTHVNTVKEE